MEYERYRGTVKFFRGSFGWLTSNDIAKKIGDRDIFLHKNQLNSVPSVGAIVEFKLVVDAKGQPKAEDAVVVSGAGACAGESKELKVSKDTKDTKVKRAALMLFRGDEVLVLREKKDDQDTLLWSDLGGKVEFGESYLECAIRELDEEARGFLSPKSIEMLKLGLRNQYGDDRQTPEVVPLKASGKYPQAVAVFPLDCSGVELDAPSGSIFDVCPLSVFYLDSFLFFLLCAVWWPSDVCPSAGLLNLSRNCWTQRAQILLEFMKCGG
ncbi:unnamed protein product [Cladocopium goreaui]|uniref:Ankyrin repeat domain-containing protein 17 n=1 Tax=Cladocopium goreaui TaxID=2562237 RepID=A0A9P1CKH0_9DINO|nr:unnamed protein product [Cladocopium goreaui]